MTEPANDLTSFHDLPSEAQAYIRTLEAQNAQLSLRVRQLEEQFRLAQLKRYAPSSEKRSERVFNEAEQMAPELTLQDSAVTLPETGLPEPELPTPLKRGRKSLPADLPRKRVEYDLSDDQKVCACCQNALHRIGYDISEQLHIPPATPWVWQHVRFKFGCRHCEQHGLGAPVVRAAMPAQPLPGSVADAATIATVITGKYADGIPLYRMEAWFARLGMDVGRGTMGHWVIGASQRHLQRLYDAMHATLLAQPLIHGDETTVQVLREDGRSPQSQSYMWVYRSSEASDTPIVLFDYQAGRGQQHPQAFLQGFTGTLMTDGYSAWRTLDGVRHLGCLAHARRYFDEAAKVQGKADSHAKQVLQMIARLYQVEALAKGTLPAGSTRVDYTYALRQQRSVPVLAALETWLDENKDTILPKSLLGQGNHVCPQSMAVSETVCRRRKLADR